LIRIDASILATVLVRGLRTARRAGVGLAEQAHRANTGLVDYLQRAGFVTGQVARIDLLAETATIVSAGHPPPLRLRHGRLDRAAASRPAVRGLPRGAIPGTAPAA
jgi:serine phosphatase RsbU (regulator of sigma subunit)